MKKILPATLTIILLSIILFISCNQPNKTTATNIRIGWQSAWATQGQLAEILQKTNIMALNDLKGDFKSFTYGAPLSEAALAGELDAAFVGDQPAITLLSKSSDWKVVGRLMDFRTGIIVPANSNIKTVADLKGKTLGIPFGSSTHRVALQFLKEAGLEPDKDVKILNIDINEQNEIIKAGGRDAWKGVDAFASWDHHIANDENQGWARIIASKTALGVVMMSQKFMNKYPGAAAKFLSAFKVSYLYYAQHQEEANNWFANATQDSFNVDLLTKVAAIEPNLRAKSIDDVHIQISNQQKEVLESAAGFALQNQLIKNKVYINNATIDLNNQIDNATSEIDQTKIKIQ